MSSDPCVFVFVRDGVKTVYADPWAGAMMQREIIWGPEPLEDFARQLAETPCDELSYTERGVLVDHDAKQLMWSGESGGNGILATKSAFQKLLQAAWPEFEIISCPEGVPVSKPTGRETDEDSNEDEIEDPFEERYETIAAAAESADAESQEDEEDEDGGGFEPDEPRAWVTLISKKQRVLHVQLAELPVEILKPSVDLGHAIAKLKCAQPPAERLVTEGVVIDMPAKTVSIWGAETLLSQRDRIDAAWKNWSVQWIDGYRAHCQAANVQGTFMSDAEAIAPVIPLLLSTQRFDASVLLSAMGGGLKKTAAKLTGCLYLVVCIPILIFAFFSGQWISALITMLLTLVIFFVVFKVLEGKVKKKMAPVAQATNRGASESAPSSAGPQEEEERRATLDALLQKSGFPPLEKVMQHCNPDDDMFSLLGT